MLEAVRGREGWRVGISSGTSEEAARIKLAAAGLSLDGLPATFSHRCPRTHTPASRADIIARTREKTIAPSDDAGRSALRAVYIGDGLWDLRAAKSLGMGFVGVRHDGDETRLRAEGATMIVRDYRDLPAFIALLEEAAA
jgi:phosphoglycolate phosphatase-like HAD superfamily hydrolase